VVSSTAHSVPSDYSITDFVPRSSLHTGSDPDLLLELSIFLVGPLKMLDYHFVADSAIQLWR